MSRRPWLLVLGIVIFATDVISTIDTATARFFWAHMLQHDVMIFIAAPLVAGSRLVPIKPRLLRSVIVVAALNAAALWAWHMPALYDAAMRNQMLHIVEHLSFLITAVLFWSVVFDGSVDRLKRVGLVFVTMLQSSALGALIAFAPEPLYQWHLNHAPPGADVLAQQQLAGAIMWVPAGVVYLAVMLALLWRALTVLDAAEQP